MPKVPAKTILAIAFAGTIFYSIVGSECMYYRPYGNTPEFDLGSML